MRRNKIADQVAQLRKQGYKVKIEHFRLTKLGMMPVRKLREMNEALTRQQTERVAVMPNGGKVRAEITKPDQTVIVGESECSLLDNFNTTTGTCIALGRAVAALAIPPGS